MVGRRGTSRATIPPAPTTSLSKNSVLTHIENWFICTEIQLQHTSKFASYLNLVSGMVQPITHCIKWNGGGIFLLCFFFFSYVILQEITSVCKRWNVLRVKLHYTLCEIADSVKWNLGRKKERKMNGKKISPSYKLTLHKHKTKLITFPPRF